MGRFWEKFYITWVWKCFLMGDLSGFSGKRGSPGKNPDPGFDDSVFPVESQGKAFRG